MTYRVDRLLRNKFINIIKQEQENKKIEALSGFFYSNPVFVLGNQKTGSTAIAALLAKCSEESVTLDIKDPIPDPSWQLIYKYKLDDFSNFIYYFRDYFAKKIIKEPSLTFFYDDIFERFPQAVYVMITRDPFDNIRSILNRLGIPGNLDSIDFEDFEVLNDYPTWKLALDSTWLGIKSTNYIEALAYRWCISADVYLNDKLNFKLIRYEDFLDDKKNSIEKLTSEVGLTVKQDISEYVNYQFQVKGSTEKSGVEFFGNKNYEIIASICKHHAKLLGY